MTFSGPRPGFAQTPPCPDAFQISYICPLSEPGRLTSFPRPPTSLSVNAGDRFTPGVSVSAPGSVTAPAHFLDNDTDA